MDEKIKKYLYDIHESINSIENYLGESRNFIVYKSNKMLRRSVERELEIIGEAINRIDKIDASLVIGGKRQITGFRNRIIHNYDNIDNEIVWGIIVKHLPLLKEEITRLLD
jgi:uncharacterized protein with HEPN domain